MKNEENLAYMMDSKLFSGFSKEECILFENILKPVKKTFLKGEVIYREGEKIKYVAMILRGRVIGERFSYDGKSHLVHTFGVKDTIGFETIYSSKEDCPITFTTSEDTLMLFFTYPKLLFSEYLSSVQQSRIKDNIIRILADQNIKNIYKLEVLSKRSLRSRILTFLEIMENKMGRKTFCIGMDREQFAQYLCVNRSALSHELGEMKKEGLINFNKDQFTINS